MTRAKANYRLRKSFDDNNELFFNNQLERPTILEYRRLRDAAGETTYLDDGMTSLVIHEDLIKFERLTEIVLLHEMAHIANGRNYKPDHGLLHDAELHRLYLSGAYADLL